MGLGNFICQAFGEKKSLDEIDYSKILRFSMFAFLITVRNFVNLLVITDIIYMKGKFLHQKIKIISFKLKRSKLKSIQHYLNLSLQTCYALSVFLIFKDCKTAYLIKNT